MQTVSDKFHRLFNGTVIPLSTRGFVSFTKKRRQDIKWFTLNQSKLNGEDLLATADNNPTQVWDAYEWEVVSNRLLEMNVERSVTFPDSVQSAIADIKLDNYDKQLTYKDGVGGWRALVLPRRPLRLLAGVDGEVVPQFVGVTKGMPQYSDDGREVSWSALDFLSEIAEQKLRETIKLRDVSTDKIIETILKQYGMTPSQYKLKAGQNVIPFVLFAKDDDAGTALKKLVQAENGRLWLDEQGIVQFETRSGNLGKQPVMTLNSGNLISIKESRESGIINRVKIKSEVRAVQNMQAIFSMENERGWEEASDKDNWRVERGKSREFWLNLDDPVWNVRDFIVNGEKTSSWLTAVNMSGQNVYSGITLSGTLFNDSYKLTVTNNTNAPVSVRALELWGEPARVVDTIEYEAHDPESIEKFGEYKLEITDNSLFGSYRNCDLFAVDVLNKRSKYSRRIEARIKGELSLQMGDIVSVEYGDISGNFSVDSIKTTISRGELEQVISGTYVKVVKPFILNKSRLDDTDALG